MRRSTSKRSVSFTGSAVLTAGLLALVGIAGPADAQNIAGDRNEKSRIDRAIVAPPGGGPNGGIRSALDTSRIYSADAPSSGLDSAMPSGAEQFDIPAETLYSWSGPYFGIRAGGVAADGNAALSGAVEAGYDFQPSDRLVFGVEADLALRGDTSSLTDTPALGTLTGRVGFLPTDRVLIFGEAGGALGSVRGAMAGGGTNTRLTPGFTVGAGAEFALDDKLTFVGEYTYTDLENRSVPTGTDDLRSSSFDAGIKLRF